MKKQNLTIDIIINKKFSEALSGYNPLEVDKYLDQIIEDYRNYADEIELLQKKLSEKKQLINSKETKIEKLGMKIEDLKLQLKESSKASNYELLQEIKKLRDDK